MTDPEMDTPVSTTPAMDSVVSTPKMDVPHDAEGFARPGPYNPATTTPNRAQRRANARYRKTAERRLAKMMRYLDQHPNLSLEDDE